MEGVQDFSGLLAITTILENLPTMPNYHILTLYFNEATPITQDIMDVGETLTFKGVHVALVENVTETQTIKVNPDNTYVLDPSDYFSEEFNRTDSLFGLLVNYSSMGVTPLANAGPLEVYDEAYPRLATFLNGVAGDGGNIMQYIAYRTAPTLTYFDTMSQEPVVYFGQIIRTPQDAGMFAPANISISGLYTLDTKFTKDVTIKGVDENGDL